MTVARVLKGDRAYARPSAERRARRIQEIAERFQYRPNQAAKAVRTGRFGTIALVLPAGVAGGLPAELLEGILAETEARDVHLTIARAPILGSRPPRLWRERSADGLLLAGNVLAVPGLPAITIGVAAASDCVYPDEIAAGRQATSLLRRLGHKSIAFVGLGGSPAVASRQAGYLEGLEGLLPRIIEPEANDRFLWARRLLATPDRPSAVVCGATGDAVPLLLAAGELGVAVPQALSVVAIDTEAVDVHLGFTPTRIVVPFHALGRLSVGCLVERIEHPERSLPPVCVPYDLRDGGTCASVD